MANVKEIIILIMYNSRVFASETVPMDLFKNGYKHTAIAYTPNFEFYAYATYVSDTAIKANVVGSNVTMYVYGK